MKRFNNERPEKDRFHNPKRLRMEIWSNLCNYLKII